ncbi:phospholipase [Shewanella sp. Choline-02u-19]|uniref:phospholipase D-like domain-containing protein n=1 Tax=unclassified Shewanella TaxID=196818 RepID=UPI000C34D435|nr:MULTISPECIES: phospholipase D family protein [unclassified Shewanella]PKG73417.1 phospholipase [Shewanella sp. GutCb]PKH63198.1 phospholipase [Shewanella sp. Bg11-22]PKI26971.1 phospholipase [Shewanella sp. Choline-02u-19]
MKAIGLLKSLSIKSMFIWAAIILQVGCQTSPQYPDKTSTFKLATQTQSVLSQYVAADLQANPDLTGVVPLIDGVDAFIARLALVNAATTSIDLQYYIYRADESGRLLLWHLMDAAERGVRVRILLDDMATKDADNTLLLLAMHNNIDVRLYNPSFERHFRNLAFISSFSRLNHRMHNKSLTVDNSITVVGGRNIGNEYFSNNTDVDFGDFDLMAIGEVVDDVSDQFDLYWNAPLTVEINALVEGKATELELAQAMVVVDSAKVEYQDNPYMKRLLSSQLIQKMANHSLPWYWGQAKLIYDQPDKQNHQLDSDSILANLGAFLSQANQEVLIVSPYFVPTRAGANNLIAAVEKGIKVTILTNSLAATDVLAVHAGYRTYRQRLLESGVRIFEVKANLELKRSSSWTGSSKSSLHAKTFIIDKHSLFVGSFNFDPRSAWLNTEMGLIIRNRELASEVVNGIGESLAANTYRLSIRDEEIVWHDDSKQREIYTEPDAGLWRKFLVDCIALLPIESQL